jgi:hypothetical protein
VQRSSVRAAAYFGALEIEAEQGLLRGHLTIGYALVSAWFPPHAQRQCAAAQPVSRLGI